jgi:hypothetical protein
MFGHRGVAGDVHGARADDRVFAESVRLGSSVYGAAAEVQRGRR